jgi:ketol-acid reductoisomerase
MLTTDESQPQVWATEIRPGLKPGSALVWASGYNVGFGLIEPPNDVDVVLVAPRMVGSEVRNRFVRGSGHLAAVGVHQDATGIARARMMAIATGIGATRGGVFECSFRHEAETDLFMEQVVLPGVTAWFETCFDLAVDHGYDPEMLVLEMYASGEMSEVFQLTAVDGFYRSMLRHSTTARFGELSNLQGMFNDELRERARRTLEEEIQGGGFARRWTTEQETGATRLAELWAEALDSPISHAEERIVPLLRTRIWGEHTDDL